MYTQDQENQKEILRRSLLNATSSEEMLKLFTQMEESHCFVETELDFYCSPIANKLHQEGNKDLEKILSFGKRGLNYLLSETCSTNIPCLGQSNSSGEIYYHNGMDLMILNGLNLLGCVCFELRRFNESLSYYNWADRNVTELLEKEASCPGSCFVKKLENAHFGLFMVKRGMGKVEELAFHMRKILECKEKKLEEGCVKLGEANRDVYVTYLAVMDVKEALPYCLKALEIHVKHFGCESVEVAEMMGNLGTIYSGLGECEKAHEHNLLARSILKKVAPNSPNLRRMELGDGYMLIELGRSEEAIDIFKGVVSHADAEGFERARAFSGMANASLRLGKFDDTKKYMGTALRIYEKDEMDPFYAAVGFNDFSKMYEKMNDLKTAISMVRRVLQVPKLPQKFLQEASSRLFSLYSLADEEKEGIPYMEDAVEKLKESFGLKHREVGNGYRKLGLVYINSGQEELAMKVLEKAKEIMDVSFGSDHVDSLVTSHYLSVAYSRLRRMDLAIELEEKVVKGVKGLGPSRHEFLGVAVEHLNKMKEVIANPDWAMISSVADLLGLKLSFGR